ncbi:sigma-70 family RNA polymerase sigma factor [Haloechinothrix sp. LS1_15]|uniref:sigma-70 family RNA polymerase sigma factor n=1 Tax=Haloechinothrix sp. LS1_15 TaxID=2652248 RepID=UPI00294419A3|nr:sigma-70 family RNA polymerase sigma factor [Haloechinothrix sp. LS1_15]MDV6011020.1 sigma-70 family RNA polymerase sigma factor [Haloechinothrix sp. LS1_15]
MAVVTHDQDFTSATNPFRPELLAHCYRMLGSIHEAEDLVQETYLRAWRSYDAFEGRSSLRTWLYRIATNTCLTALESRNRRPMPTGLGGPSEEPEGDLDVRHEVPWLEPIPDSSVDAGNDPAAVVTSRESLRLALIAALQHLPPRQRAVLLLRDVLRWRAAEVADLLDVSTAAANSMLQRARAQLAKVTPSEDTKPGPISAEQRKMLEKYVEAFERKDVTALVELFTSDAVWEMPPFAAWFQGPAAIGTVIATQCPAGSDDLRLLPTAANGQPAFGVYMRDGTDGTYRKFQLQVLTLTGGTVSHVAAFFDLSLFEVFGLPEVYPGDERTGRDSRESLAARS